jgi:uracil phosphoribosyltransferase
MIDAITSLLPEPVPVHHLGLYREKTTLQPVEYYNNLPYHKTSSSSSTNPSLGGGEQEESSAAGDLAIIMIKPGLGDVGDRLFLTMGK